VARYVDRIRAQLYDRGNLGSAFQCVIDLDQQIVERLASEIDVPLRIFPAKTPNVASSLLALLSALQRRGRRDRQGVPKSIGLIAASLTMLAAVPALR
jgi:hypothetical protein